MIENNNYFDLFFVLTHLFIIVLSIFMNFNFPFKIFHFIIRFKHRLSEYQLELNNHSISKKCLHSGKQIVNLLFTIHFSYEIYIILYI